MIDLYTFSTPNGWKVSIMLEECALDYAVHPVKIFEGEQHETDFRRINPNRKIPAIVDRDGLDGKPTRVFESGAILLYLAEKTGRLLGPDAAARLDVLQYLFLESSGMAPNAQNAYRMRNTLPDDAPAGMAEFGSAWHIEEVRRLFGVLDYRLREYEYLAKTYTIADIAHYPWVAMHEMLGIDLDDFVGLRRWFESIGRRKNVQAGMKVPRTD